MYSYGRAMYTLRTQVIKLAYGQPGLRSVLLPLVMHTASFEDAIKDRTFKNPDTGNDVQFGSLPDVEQKRIRDQYHKHTEKGNPVTPAKRVPKPKYKTDRYSHIEEGMIRHKDIEDLIKEHHLPFEKIPDDILDTLGVPILLEGHGDSVVDAYELDQDHQKGIYMVVTKGPYVKQMSRWLGRDEKGKPYIYNDVFQMHDHAPAGLGTKVFAAQVSEAKEKGFDRIECFAIRAGDDWVGYKVWPKMGYDGPIPIGKASKHNPDKKEYIPLQKWPAKFDQAFVEKGFKKPWKVSHLYQVPGGMEWWDKWGCSFDAKFDLKEGSQSMRVLAEYLEKKAGQEGIAVEDWMSKVARLSSRVNKSAELKPTVDRLEGHEDLTLTPEDLKILEAIWSALHN